MYLENPIQLVNATPRPLYPQEGAPVPIVQEARCAPGPIRTGVDKGKPLDPTAQTEGGLYTHYALPSPLIATVHV
jgi:hypothetical protein